MDSHSFVSGRSSHFGAIGTPVHPPAATPSNSSTIAANETLAARLERVLLNEQEKNSLLQELMMRYEYVTQQLERLTGDPNGMANWQAERQQYIARDRSWQAALARNPFVVVLIDGDGMVFRDEFLREGETGGRRAAAQLQNAITAFIETESKTIPTESRILCRIYANVKGLADVLVRIGAIGEVSLFEDFVRGFTRGRTLFDFVDVGPGKDRADEKVVESFKLFIDDYHCRQIFFGCSHDNGFARLLEVYMTDKTYLSRVTLLEGVPFEKELVVLPYRTKKFPSLFRDAKITVGGSIGTPAMRNDNQYTGLPSRFPPSRASSAHGNYVMDSPIFAKLATNMPRTPSSSTLASDSTPAIKSSATGSWASKAAAPAPPASAPPVYQPVNRDEIIARNRAGQRVDPQCRDYDKAEVDRIKKIKMCNVHFLRNECPYDANCTHLHNYEPTANEVATLRLVARMAPCQNGSGCQDIKCIYGHRCPAPPAKAKLPPGTKNCIFGEACKFPPELHDIDCNVVKTLVIR